MISLGRGKSAVARRLAYYRRITSAYVTARGRSAPSFWHDDPAVNPNGSPEDEYYMPFREKADHPDLDERGVPLLDYRGTIGRQHNPIAIAQFGLGNLNLFLRDGGEDRRERALAAADWLADSLEPNPAGVWVWNHHFDWEYRTPLRAPWYSGLAQGQGISLLVRAYRATGREAYLEAADRAFGAFFRTTDQGGVTHVEDGDVWFEEYIVQPPTHILNGFIWGSWGVLDLARTTANARAEELFARAVDTLQANLARFDVGFWSLYELSGTRLKMIASPYYHRLHVTQLRVMHRLTGEETFVRYADRWEGFLRSRSRRAAALAYKAAFKLLHY